jgi:lipopolysaccharide transport system ATP-binding protein
MSSIEVDGISKTYRRGEMHHLSAREAISAMFARRRPHTKPQEFRALDEISFSARGGDVVGILGHNGAGKSTLLKILARITSPTSGRIVVRGRIASLLEVGTGFHPELTGRENIFLNGAILGMKRAEVTSKFDEIVAFAEIEEFIDTPVKRYSSGMYVRLAFAVAAHLQPEILLVDEVLAVGDVRFQRKCLGRMGESANSGRTILFVSHNIEAVRQLCTRVIVLDHGRITADCDPADGISFYLGDDNTDLDPHVWENTERIVDNDYFLPLRMTVDSQGHFLNNQPITVTIDGIIKAHDPALQIGIGVYDGSNRLLFRSYSTDTSEASWPVLKLGTMRLTVDIPPHLLNEGHYRVELLAASYLRSWHIAPGSSAFVRFTIQGGLSESPYWNRARDGSLAPVLPWKAST